MNFRRFSYVTMLFCLLLALSGQYTTCTPDTDGDGIIDPQDNCKEVYNPFQTDKDGDDIGDACDALLSCMEIKELSADVIPEIENGIYTIDPDGDEGEVEPFQVYCDMTTDGGGWTLIMKAIHHNYYYDESYWTDNEVENADNFDFSTKDIRAKYASFYTVPLTEIRTSDPTDFSITYSYALSKDYDSAKALFAGDGIQISTTIENYFNSRTPDDGKHWGCNTYVNVGINQKAYLGIDFIYGGSYCDWNGGARFGQRINGYHGGTGNHAGQGWGSYSIISGHEDNYKITELLWVR